jgi:hypothetical protein
VLDAMGAMSSHDLRISNIWTASDGVLVLLLGYRHFQGVLFLTMLSAFVRTLIYDGWYREDTAYGTGNLALAGDCLAIELAYLQLSALGRCGVGAAVVRHPAGMDACTTCGCLRRDWATRNHRISVRRGLGGNFFLGGDLRRW